jgi:hypothetical protein
MTTIAIVKMEAMNQEPQLVQMDDLHATIFIRFHLRWSTMEYVTAAMELMNIPATRSAPIDVQQPP